MKDDDGMKRKKDIRNPCSRLSMAKLLTNLAATSTKSILLSSLFKDFFLLTQLLFHFLIRINVPPCKSFNAYSFNLSFRTTSYFIFSFSLFSLHVYCISFSHCFIPSLKTLIPLMMDFPFLQILLPEARSHLIRQFTDVSFFTSVRIQYTCYSLYNQFHLHSIT